MRLMRRSWRLFILGAEFLRSLIRANVEVTHLLVTPHTAEAAVIGLELETANPWLITAFGSLVSLTPGTLVIDVAEDRSRIYIHVLATRPLDVMREELSALQRRLLEVMQ